MSDCPELEQCRYFKEVLSSMPTIAEMMTLRFCMGDPEQCARHKVRCEVGDRHVPADLAPNAADLARRIIEEHRPV